MIIQNTTAIAITSCTITTNQIVIVLSVSSTATTFKVLINGFHNPSSTQTISGISATLTNSTATKATYSSAQINSFTPDTMTSASLSPSSDLIGDTNVVLTITLVNKNILSQSGQIIVQFPYWNPSATVPQNMITTTSPTCTGITSNMPSSINCAFNSLSSKLTLSNVLSVSSAASGSTMTFTVTNFINPYSAVPKCCFIVSTADSNGYYIDQIGSLSVTVNTWASFSDVEYDRQDGITTVDELSQAYILFQINLPVDASCQLRIDFPSDQPLTTDLSTVTGATLFQTPSVQTTNVAGNYIIINGCSQYYDAPQTAVVFLSDVLNAGQVKTTNSFKVSLYAVSSGQSYAIAQQTTGIQVTAPDQLTEGSISSFSLTAVDSTTIQATTRYQITVKPTHAIPTSSQLVITFPSTITLTAQSACTLSSNSGGISTSPGGCTVANNVLTITNPFGTGSYTKNGPALSFIFSVGGTNPISAKDAGTFEVDTFAVISGTSYYIDSSNFTNVFTPTPYPMTASVYSVSSLVTYNAPTTYTLSITPQKAIPAGGYLIIQLPTEVTLQSSSLSSCQFYTQGTTTTLSQCTVQSTGPVVLKIVDAFTSGDSNTGVEYRIILGGLRNPRTTETTSSFQLTSYDSSGAPIEYVTSGLTVTMTSYNPLSAFSITPSSGVNGATASYKVSATAVIPIISTDVMTFTFPSQITLPSSCSITAGTSLSSASCSYTGQVISVTLTCSSGQISVSTEFDFTLSNIVNPSSTQPTSSFSNILMQDAIGTAIANYAGSVIITDTTPATVITKSLSQSTKALFDSSVYTITYTTINPMAAQAAFQITYPTSVTTPVTFNSCYVTYNSIQYSMSTCSINTASNQILVNTGISVAIPATSSIQIVFDSFTNPSTSNVSLSFSLTSYTDATYAYSIDTITSGLVPAFDCAYPCLTCSSFSVCTSCITNISTESYKYLSGNQCLTSCPNGTYADSNYICQTCPSVCQTCSDTSTCTSCYTNTSSLYPYLLQGWCYASCPSGYCAAAYQCTTCNANSFASVTVTGANTTVSQSTTLTFIATLSSDTYADNDVITFTIPSPGQFTPTTSSSACSAISPLHAQSCVISANQVSIRFTVTGSNRQIGIFTVSGFINPRSTCPISGIQTNLVNSTGYTTDLFTLTTLSNFVPAVISTLSLASSSQVVAASAQTVTATFTSVSGMLTNDSIGLVLPYWNPSSSSPSHMISLSTPTCSGTSPFLSSLSCTYSLDSSRTLTLTSLLTTAQSSGQSLTFTFNSFQNPYNAIPKSGFTLTTYDSQGCSVDQGTVSLTVSTFAALTSPTVSRADTNTQVSLSSSANLAFSLPFPIDSNCRFRVDFPSDMPLDSSLTTVNGFGIFTGTSTFHTESIASNYFEVNGCTTYQDGGSTATLNIASIVNLGWVKDTSTFIYTLYAMSGSTYYNIAQTSSGLIFPQTSFTPGPITAFTLSASDTEVMSTSLYALTITPDDSIPTNSQIQVIFPSSITLTDQTGCTLSNTTGVVSSGFTSCVVASNVLTITNPFGTGSYTKNGPALSFVFSVGGTNPTSVADAGSFIVNTFAVISGASYAIDSSTFTNVFTPTASPLAVAVSSVSSLQTSASPTNYVLSVTPTKSIPSGAMISIQIPSQITLPSGSSSLTKCIITMNGVATTYQPCPVTGTSPITLTLTGFPAYSNTGTSFTIELDGLQNPRNTQTTNSFQVNVTDSNGNAIQSATSGVTVQMTSYAPINTFNVNLASLINGQTSTTYTFQVTSSIAQVTGDYLQFTFPAEVTLGTTSCAAVSQLSAVTCTKSGSTLKVKLTFTSSPLSSGTQFSFSVSGITNPHSTQPTSAFSNVIGLDSNSFQIEAYSGSTIVQTTVPASISTDSLTQGNQNIGVATTYTLTFTTINPIPAGGAFLVSFPSSVSASSSTIKPCTVTVGSNTYTMTTCTVTGSSGGTIKVDTGLGNTIAAGTSVSINFNQITNPQDQTSTSSFTIMTYTDNTYQYKIDYASQGMIPSFACTLPCKTCTSTKTQCTSCFNLTSTTLLYLNNSQCLSSCPSGYYADSNNVCQTCPTQCATCSSATSCLTCNTATKSLYPLFYDNYCYSQCPAGTYNNSNICVSCSSNCLTCDGSSTNCTSCNASSAVPYLQGSACVNTCNSGYVPLNQQCAACTKPCQTCIVSQSTCTSCTTGYLYGTQCVSSCPVGTVLNTTQGRCIGCDPNCAQCNPNNITQCLVCNTGYLVYQSICLKACPDGYVPDSTNTTCKANSTTSNNNPPTNNVTPTTTDNSNGTIYVYFPVTITQTVMGGVSAASLLKDAGSIFSTNSLSMWGPLEMAAYGGQTYLSYNQITSNSSTENTTLNTSRILSDIWHGRLLAADTSELGDFSNKILPIVFFLTGFSMVVKFCLNMTFLFSFVTWIRHDEGYKEHRASFKCIPMTVIIIGSIFSYQIGGMFYSRFFGHQGCSLRLNEMARYYTLLNTLRILNIVFCHIPIVAVDIYGLINYKWGNQFYIIMIETLLLCISIIVITFFEIRAQKKLLKQHEQDQMVYAAVADESNMDDLVMKRMNDEFMKRFDGQSLEEFMERLKRDKELEKYAYQTPNRGLRRGQSMTDLHRDLEEDERRVNTDPLDAKQKSKYDKWVNPFAREDQFDNCYAEPGTGDKKTVDPANRMVKITQNKDAVMTEDEYAADFEKRNGYSLFDVQSRGKQFAMMTNLGDEENNLQPKKKNRLRGRKGKYYEQVDDEDQTFLEDSRHGLLKDDEEDYGHEDEDRLDMIEEESHNSLEDLRVKEEQKKLEDKILESNRLAQQNDIEKQLQNQNQSPDKDKQDLFESVDAAGEQALPSSSQNQQTQPQLDGDHLTSLTDQPQVINDELVEGIPDEEGGIEEDNLKKFKTTLDVQNEIERDELLMGAKQQNLIDQQNQKSPDQKKKDEEDLKNHEESIIKEHDNETGEPDSDDDEETRIKNMTDPNKRKFNVNDILGEFDRDEKGNLVILQNNSGSLIDKDGNRVNEKGYLIDEKTGDVLEKEQKRKIFDSKDLDERGELPPPFNLERFNFNLHDVRGYFDRDAEGNEIIGNRRDAQGNIIDKLGRRVNEHGYLIDAKGNLVDKRGRMKLHRQILNYNDGQIPLLFNYKGKKFDLIDVCGDLDKDRNGNFILRRDKDNNLVDKKGRRVNKKGYLIDKEGNVVNNEGKIMFERHTLSVDDEIPKLFPFLKFNLEDIKGDYEMDPLGNPMLHKTRDGQLVDSKGRRVNEKGYLLDDNGNVRNKRGFKVFGRNLLEDDGDIPKIFRTGLLRKDTYDSFSQLMSEIEDLERLQEMDVNDPRRKLKQRHQSENERLQKRIDKIVEEDNDDDDLLMKELEDLANDQGISDGDNGGNTSVDSAMEDTPSNYDAANQRYNEIENIKNQALRNLRNQRAVAEDLELESEYSYLPGKKTKKKKKKKKAKKRDDEIDLRDLMMAQAYGGLSQSQIQKLMQMKKVKETAASQALAAQSQLGMTSGPAQFNQVQPPSSNQQRPPIQRNSSNLRMQTVNSRRGQQLNKNNSQVPEDFRSDFGGAESHLSANNMSVLLPGGLKGQKFGVTEQLTGSQTAKGNTRTLNQTTSRLNGRQETQPGHKLRTNNLMAGSEKGDLNSQKSDKNIGGGSGNDRDRRLSHIANSVSGFYRGEENKSEHSVMRSTHESNFAQNIGQLNFNNLANNTGPLVQLEEAKTAGKVRGNRNTVGDQELERIYGTARGLADFTMLSDWEKDSQKSRGSARSQMGAVNTLKVRGLENIYLQRLEPANKGGGRKTQMKKDKAKFRMMHHKFHDEPEWHVDEPRDELDSVISDNYKQMEKKFVQEFQGAGSGERKKGSDHGKSNLFHRNFYQYKHKQAKVPNLNK